MLMVLAVLHLTFVTLLACIGIHRLILTALYWAHRDVRPPVSPLTGDFPHITVQLPLYDERFVAARALEAAAALRWPTQRLHIQVLDDSTDDTPAIVAETIARLEPLRPGLTIQHLRRASRDGFKAGALQHGIERIPRQGDAGLLLVLDADFVPGADFLERMVPHLGETGASMAQARWTYLNRDDTWFTELQGLLLDGHFLVEHQARFATGSFFNFNGSGGILSRRMIEDAGGWQADTLTEDLDLSYRAQLRGHRFAYVTDVPCPGELPARLSELRSQQFRWVKGSLQTARKLMGPVLRSSLPLPIRVEAALHLLTNLVYPFLTLAFLTWVPLIVGPGLPLPAAVHVLLVTGGLGSMALFYGTAQLAGPGASWRLAYLLPAALACAGGLALNHTVAALQGLFGSRGEFVRTPKGYPMSRSRHERWLPVLEILLSLYLSGGALLAAQRGFWSAVPFLVLFATGLAAFGLSGLAARDDGVRSSPRPADIRNGTPQEGSLMVFR